MPLSRTTRVWLTAALQVGSLALAVLTEYDRGPVAALAARAAMLDRDREALRCEADAAVARAAVAARTAANAVRAPDGALRYAVVRAPVGCAAPSTPGSEARRAFIAGLLVLSALGVLWRAVRMTVGRGARSTHRPPNESLQLTGARSAPAALTAATSRVRR